MANVHEHRENKRFDSSGVDFQTVKYMNERDGLAYSSKNNTTGKLLFEENLKITSLEFTKEIRKLDVDVDCEVSWIFRSLFNSTVKRTSGCRHDLFSIIQRHGFAYRQKELDEQRSSSGHAFVTLRQLFDGVPASDC